jgi:nicotinamide-nucleotide amidase
MKASIIGVGTEITSGQILNSNGQWISKKMTQLGVEVSVHVSIPDDHKLILKTLDFCKDKSEIIFVTGGLGPTSDDFTRDVIGKWARKKMIYDPNTFAKIETRLKERGVPVRESQKQQCYYPAGSHVLENSMGTANAFYLETKNKKVFVLPGPPKEIEAVWNDHLEKLFFELTKDLDRLQVKAWKCVGYGESEVAHRVETALKGCKLTKAYRFRAPYVEVKLSYFDSQKEDAMKWIEKVEHAIGDITDKNIVD